MGHRLGPERPVAKSEGRRFEAMDFRWPTRIACRVGKDELSWAMYRVRSRAL
jgi:hypothetical protein